MRLKARLERLERDTGKADHPLIIIRRIVDPGGEIAPMVRLWSEAGDFTRKLGEAEPDFINRAAGWPSGGAVRLIADNGDSHRGRIHGDE